MKFPKFILLSGLLLALLVATAAARDLYRFDTWTTDNGLPQNGVRSITQTPDGYLWFTTFDGLVRFDGVQFTTFNKSNTKGIVNNRFTSIFADTDGTIYAATTEDGTLTIYRDGQFSSLTSDQIPGHYIDRVERDDGGLRMLIEDMDRKGKSWHRFAGGVFTFIEHRKENFDVREIAGKDGVRWRVTESGVTRIDQNGTQNTPIDLKGAMQRMALFVDSAGSLWISEKVIYRINAQGVKRFSVAEGLPNNVFYTGTWEEADGSIWLRSGSRSSVGVGLVQIKQDEARIWGAEVGLASTTIESVFIDREGTVWLATGKGLSRRRKQIIQGFSKEHGIDHSEVYPLLKDRDGSIWIGSTQGLSKFANGRFEPVEIVPARTDLPSEFTWRPGQMSVQSLWQEENGDLLVGVNGGLFRVSGNKAELVHQGSHVVAIQGDRHGNVWIASNVGLLRFNDGNLTAQYDASSGLPSDLMTFIFEDSKGTLWFGGYGGLTKYENGTFQNFTTSEGLTGNYVRTIHEDSEGTMWIGTYDEGMSRFKDGKFSNIREIDGLFNAGVFAIQEDERGFFWISSNRGIYRVSRSELNDFADGKIHRINSVGYGRDDGMLSTECNGGRQPASVRDEFGRFWFPTQDGVAVVDPSAETGNPLPPSVVIEKVFVERESAAFREGLKLEPGRKDIEIRFTAMSLIKSDQIKFQYKLEGHDADWTDAGTRRTAIYSYLPPGDYTFRVRAANSDGVWNEQGASLAMELQPHFYETREAVLLAVFGAALLLFLVWKASVHQLEIRERRLAKLVEDRTSELAEANESLRNLANSDGLTKIGNRRRFASFLADEWHRAIRFKTPISLLLIDIDHFKQFNDTYGHQAGDECLQLVAESLAKTIHRPTDLVARFGGEEFAIVLGGTDSEGASQIAREAVEKLRGLDIIHSSSPTEELLTVSVGVATLMPVLDSDEATLIAAADTALYDAKNNGRNRISVIDHTEGMRTNPGVYEQAGMESRLH